MPSALSAQLRELQWRQVPQRAVALAKSAADAARDIRTAIQPLPSDGYLDLWYSATKHAAFINFGAWYPEEDAPRWKAALADVVPTDYTHELEGSLGDDWVKVATQPPGILYQKRAYSPTLRGMGSLFGYFPDYYGKIPGIPSPLGTTLASGALGAGLGYGAGMLAEKVLPEKWKRNRLRRTLAVLGGLGAAAPAVAWGGVNLANYGPAGLLKGEPFDTPPDVTGTFRRYSDQGELLNKLGEAEELLVYKQARPNAFIEGGSGDTGAFPPPIDAEAFIQNVYSPQVSQQLPRATQAAAAGLVIGAGHQQTGGRHMPRLVSPVSVGNMAAGMGSGWLSGMLVGKALGALTGMPASAQKRLTDAGLWAGVIANVVPLAFPNRG
jgi:hypothetical protein